MTRIHILGSGTPTPHPDRFGSSFAIELPSREIILVDCGPATTSKLAKAGLDIRRVSTLFFTHHHFDHNADAACLILSRWDQLVRPHHQTAPFGLIHGAQVSDSRLRVYGPPSTTELCDRLIGSQGAYASDFTSRLNWTTTRTLYTEKGGLEPREPPQVQAQDIGPGWDSPFQEYRVIAGRAEHAQPTMDCLAYRFEFPDGKKIAFSGDTAICDEVVELAKGVDYFFCMALDIPIPEGGEKHRKGGCLAGCSDSRTAGAMASRAGVKSVVLVHQGGNQDREGSIRRAEESFHGEVIYGEEMMCLDV